MIHSENIDPVTMNMEKPRTVRRCLFGRPDPVQLQHDLQNTMNEITENETKRFENSWGFNLKTEQPVEGGLYLWEQVRPTEQIPSFYLKGYAPRKQRPVSRIRSGSRSPTLFSRRSPLTAKRKLDLSSESEEDVENKDNMVTPFVNESALGLPVYDTSFAEYRLCDSDPSPPSGLSRSSSTPSLHELSPATQAHSIVTPPTRSRSLTQSSITDYMVSIKKSRISTKSLPRT